MSGEKWINGLLASSGDFRELKLPEDVLEKIKIQGDPIERPLVTEDAKARVFCIFHFVDSSLSARKPNCFFFGFGGTISFRIASNTT